MSEDNFKGNPFDSGGDNFTGNPFDKVLNDAAGSGYDAATSGSLDGTTVDMGNIATRFGRGLIRPAIGLSQKLGHLIGQGDTMDAEVARYNANAPSVAGGGMDIAGGVGNIASPINFAIPGGGLAKTIAGGVVGGLAEPIDPGTDNFWEESAKQAAIGGTAAPLLSRILRGFTPTTEAKKLMDMGIQPTIGQAKNGWVNRIEQQAQSIPIIGDLIRIARQRPLNEFHQLEINNAISNATPVKTLGQANQYADNLYNESIPNISGGLDAPLLAAGAATAQRANPELTRTGRNVLASVEQQMGQIPFDAPGELIKSADGELGFLIRRYARSQQPSDQALADSLRQVQQSFRQGMEASTRRNGQGAAADMLQEANRAYARLVPLNVAASSRADNAIMPRALQKSVARQRGTQTSKMQDDYLSAATHVLPDTVPDSGTAGRAALALLTGGGASMIPGGLPVLGGASALTGAAYLRPVQKALLGGYDLPADDMALAMIAALRGDGEQP